MGIIFLHYRGMWEDEARAQENHMNVRIMLWVMGGEEGRPHSHLPNPQREEREELGTTQASSPH